MWSTLATRLRSYNECAHVFPARPQRAPASLVCLARGARANPLRAVHLVGGDLRPARGRSLSAGAVRRALEAPVAGPSLRELARGRKDACVAVEDGTRPSRLAEILPEMLQVLHDAGIPRERTRIVVGSGGHAPMDRPMLVRKLGRRVVDGYAVANHNPYEDLVDLGRSPRGIPIHLNRTFHEADLKIAAGSVLPHPYAGFGGGAKIVLPGLSGIETLEANHRPVVTGVHGGPERRGDEPGTGTDGGDRAPGGAGGGAERGHRRAPADRGRLLRPPRPRAPGGGGPGTAGLRHALSSGAGGRGRAQCLSQGRGAPAGGERLQRPALLAASARAPGRSGRRHRRLPTGARMARPARPRGAPVPDARRAHLARGTAGRVPLPEPERGRRACVLLGGLPVRARLERSGTSGEPPGGRAPRLVAFPCASLQLLEERP
jgi:hypothetical protein